MTEPNWMTNVFLFQDISPSEKARLTEEIHPVTASFQKGETVFDETIGRRIGFILSGECEAERIRKNGQRVSLNTLTTGDSFGILSLFSDENFPTVVRANRKTTVLFLTEEDVRALISASPTVSVNMLRFLSERVCFLNRKIAALTETRVEDKLARYLLNFYEESGKTDLPFHPQLITAHICCGRASLYRAVDALAQTGAVTMDGKNIVLLNRKKLEEILL